MIDTAIVGLKVVGAYLVLSLFDGHFDQASLILDVIAICAIGGAVLTYNRIKAALVASESAGKAWREERDAALSHVNRISLDLTVANDEKVKLIAKVTALEAKPDLTRLEGLVAEATAATKDHEVKAGERSERLIAAVHSIADGQRSAAEILANPDKVGIDVVVVNPDPVDVKLAG